MVVHISHINVGKAKSGHHTLMQHLREKLRGPPKTQSGEVTGRGGSFMVSINEPAHTTKGYLRDLSKEHTIIQAKGVVNPRAAIFASKDLDLWPVTEYTTRDVVPCLWVTGKKNLPEIVVVSVYMENNIKLKGPNKSVWPKEFENLVTFCARNKKPILVLSDSNAHSEWWGSPESNKRGEELEEFILKNGLLVLNRGSEPTFVNALSKSHVDIALCSPELKRLIKNWHVNNKL